VNETNGRRRFKVRAERIVGPNGELLPGIPAAGEVITREDGAQFTVLSIEPDGERHLVMVLEATARA